MPIAEDLATILQTASVGTLGDTLFWGRGLTDTPDAQVAVQAYGGMAPVRAMTATVGSVAAERPRCQVVSRALEHSTAETTARSAWTALTNYKGTVNGTVILDVSPVQSPFYIGPDDQGRSLVAFNVDVWVKGA